MFNFFKKWRNKGKHSWIIKSPVNGKIVKLENVNDETFSKKMMGEGIAVSPTEKAFYSPVDGKLISIYENSNHAYTFNLNDDIDIIMHIGLDTVNIKKEEKVFDVKIEANKDVDSSINVVNVDIDKIKELNYDPVTPIILINKDADAYELKFLVNDGDEVTHGQNLIEISKKG